VDQLACLTAVQSRVGGLGEDSMSAASWNIAGSVLSLLGLLILFRYGMPYRVRTGGVNYIITEQIDEEELKADKRYEIFGWVGLFFAVRCTLCQIAANIPAMIR
jgi:hypothetical protein